MKKKPNPKCEICTGTGFIPAEVIISSGNFRSMKCDCTKEESTVCVDCGIEEKNPGLECCGICYDKRIWG